LPYKLASYNEVLILFLLIKVIDQEFGLGNKIFFIKRLFLLY